MSNFEKFAIVIAHRIFLDNNIMCEDTVRHKINTFPKFEVSTNSKYIYEYRYDYKTYTRMSVVDVMSLDEFYLVVEKYYNSYCGEVGEEDSTKTNKSISIKKQSNNDKITSHNPLITEYVDKEMSAYFWDNDNIEKTAKQVIILLASNDIDHVDDEIDDIISNNIEFAEFLNSWNNGRKIRKIADRVIQKYSKMLDKEKREKESAESTARTFITMWKEGK